MKKLLITLILLCLIIPGISYANLISNPGFEYYSGNNFDSWTEGGFVYQNINPVYEGLSSARIGVPGGYLYQPFSISEGDFLYFGAWFLINTNSLTENWDQIQINLQIASMPDTTIGGAVSNFVGEASFTYNSQSGYTSEWFLIADTISLAYVPVNAAINISLQNYDSELTKVFVDNAFAETASVPEPATMLLLGTGLVGLAGFRRKFKKK